ncbi:MAG: hypothetical protein ACPGPD_09715 [Pseudomonadales bacterium]
MSDMEKLIRDAETDIDHHGKAKAARAKKSVQLPRVSVPIVIWFIAIITAAFQFDTIVAPFSETTDTQIEENLSDILSSAAATLKKYELANGSLPPLLPNPAVRGLVEYQRLNDFSFHLEATIGDVTMVMESSKPHPFRKKAP